MNNFARFRRFVEGVTRLVDIDGQKEPVLLAQGESLLRELIAHDDWLPAEVAAPSGSAYRQYLLYCDPFERLSVVSFVWMPGQRTPIHDHTVWGLVGILRGEERCEEYDAPRPGERFAPRGQHPVKRGEVDKVSPAIGDIHVVSNSSPDSVSVSIHVYGGNIGAIRRHSYDPATGATREFVSGYDNRAVPNWWGPP
jgi:predicted metal-dependent enzyme (double-stranded beta helix superfamily)